MRSGKIFYIGIAINIFAVLLSVDNSFLMDSSVRSSDGTVYSTDNGLSSYGKMMSWLIPLGFLAVIGTGFWLRSAGKTLAANILVWVPALPMLAGILVWGGLAVLFILFGK